MNLITLLEKALKTDDKNTMSYTIQDKEKLLRWIESKFVGDLSNKISKIKESLIKKL